MKIPLVETLLLTLFGVGFLYINLVPFSSQKAACRLLSRLRLIATVAHVARGTHLGREDVHHFRARGFEVVSEEPLACIADGELMVESERFSVDVDERALTLLVPALYADAREPIFSSQDSRAA